MKRVVFIIFVLLFSLVVFGNIYAFLGIDVLCDQVPTPGSVAVYDVTDPLNPTEIYFFETELVVTGFNKVGDFIYVYFGDEMFDSKVGIIIINFSDPVNPFIEKEVLLSQGIYLAEMKDNYLFGASWDKGLLVLDISDPLNPEEISSFQFEEFNMWQGVRDLSIRGDYAYLATMDGEGWFPGPKAKETKSGLVIADISDQNNIKLVSYYKKNDWGSVFSEVKVLGNYAYCSTAEWGLDVLDISDPYSPKFASRNDTGTTFGSIIYNNYLYVSVKDNGLKVFDLSNPADPELVGRYFVLGASVDVVNINSLILMAGQQWGGILLDISDPENPKYLSTLPISENRENWAIGLFEVN